MQYTLHYKNVGKTVKVRKKAGIIGTGVISNILAVKTKIVRVFR